MPRARRQTRPAASAASALLVVACLVPGLAAGPAQAADPATCVGKAEYKAIHGGMGIAKLSALLDGQSAFADVAGKGKSRVRWYAACDEWQPEKDVAVSYHEPVVGRRTVTKKKLAVYVAP